MLCLRETKSKAKQSNANAEREFTFNSPFRPIATALLIGFAEERH